MENRAAHPHQEHQGVSPSSHRARVASNRVSSNQFLKKKALGTRLASNKVGQPVSWLCMSRQEKKLKLIKYKFIRNPKYHKTVVVIMIKADF